MPHTVSIIIATRDEDATILSRTVERVIETSITYNREIVIIDDASIRPVQFTHPKVRVIRHDAPTGVQQSRRHGGCVASGDVLVWLDAHMSFAPDWLDKMMAHVDSGSVLCAAWWDYTLSQPLCWGADFAWCRQRNYRAMISPGFSFRHRTKFPGHGAVEVPMCIGACYMILRETYDKLGGFSPFSLVWGKSEQDLCARAWIMKFGVKCVTDARVGHLTRTKFPYPVRWEHVEFNQVAMIRTVFQKKTAEALERALEPLPADVRYWLTEVDFSAFHRLIQSRRQISDQEFFQRFVPDIPQCAMNASGGSSESVYRSWLRSFLWSPRL
jgi:glycosyltransferase involved in cell wall biosynthesis